MDDRFYSPQANVPGEGIIASYGPRFWGLVVTIGVLAGLGGGLLMVLLHTLQHVFWNYHHGGFLPAVKRASHIHRVAVLVGAGALAGVGALVLRRSRGLGGGEVSEALWLGDGHLDVAPSTGRGVLSVAIVAGGASLGREAAPQLTSAAIASWLCEYARLPVWQRRLLVASGAGAGMAAVYNVPIGGALFAIEVLLGTVNLPLVLPALATSTIATVVAWVVLPNSPTYSMPEYRVSGSLIVWALVFGPLAGFASVAWIRLVQAAHNLKPQAGWRKLLRPVLVLGLLGVLSIAYPQLLGNGVDPVQLALAMKLTFALLLALAVLKPLVTAACLGSGAPGGLFTPTLAYGVLLAGALGHVWGTLWSGTPEGALALVGGAAVLGASMQGPLAAIVLILELVDHSNTLIAPTVIAVTLATVVARRLGAQSIYSARLGEKPS